MSYKLGLFLTGNALIRRGASCFFNVGELSSECGASRLGARFLQGELSLGEMSCPIELSYFLWYHVELICSLFYVLFILEQIIFHKNH